MMDQASASKRVMVVDDNADAAYLVAELLTARGHIVQVAMGGPQGLDAATETLPDVVLLDIGMPVMDGYLVATALREGALTKSIRLVTLTAWGDTESRASAIKSGFDGQLLKPANLGALFSAIEISAV